MWFGTSSVSELQDMPFDKVKTGPWYSNLADVDSDITEYAHFLQNHPGDTASTGFDSCVWVVDSKRSKDIASSRRSDFNGKARNTLLDAAGDSRFTVNSYSDKLYLNGSDLGHQSQVDELNSTAGNWIGAYIYTINSATENNIGNKAQVS